MEKSLVIVESPAKSKTLAKFLGNNYDVASCMGHLIDLPSSAMGVDVKKGFKPKYVVIASRKKLLAELQEKAKGKDAVYLATDPDREGEAISWHLSQHIVSDNQKVVRVEFHEITKQAIDAAFKNPRQIDINRVNAQQARRILDRIVGYNLSPLLWEKVGRGLSAGRVQSVALRLIVEREQEINRFIPLEYWELDAQLSKPAKASEFIAKLVQIDSKKPEVKTQAEADLLVEALKARDFIISDIKEQKKMRTPAQSYTTSTMQQDAFNKLRFSASKTMRTAQQLYEGLEVGDEGSVGLITYMRTDSTQVAKEAQDAAKDYIINKFGKEYIPHTPHKAKKSKQKTQQAHEAIRPTSVHRDPDSIKECLTSDQFRLYNLIWTRFMQSQMAQAILKIKTIEITVETSIEKAAKCLFRCSGTELLFDGFLRLSNTKDADEKLDMADLSVGEKLLLVKLTPSQHFTKPPARFSDASLVKELEEKGIGRPSTYAPIIQTITQRHYVERREGYFYPSEVGIVVTELLIKHFPGILNADFTAEMESELDKVEEGEMDWAVVLKNFYTPFEESLSHAQVKMEDMKKRKVPTEYKCELCNRPMLFRWSKMGTFLGCSGFPKCKNSKPARRTEDGRIEIVEAEATDRVCEKCGKPMVVKRFNRGRFLSCSGYPQCKNTKPFPTGVQCPQPGCNGELVERSSRRGPFYGCSNYPNCSYTVRKLPEK